MTNFDYKKYSLENLEKWLDDVLCSDDATPQEIYDVILKVVSEHYYHHKHHASRAYELMEKLNGSVNFTSCDKEDKSPECQKSWDDFWNDVDEKHRREYNLREAEYYNKRVELDASQPKTYEEMVADGWEMTADGFWWREPKEDKVVKWILPVKTDEESGEYFFEFPDDLLEVTGLKEGDQVEWIDRKDGSFELRKVNGTK